MQCNVDHLKLINRKMKPPKDRKITGHKIVFIKNIKIYLYSKNVWMPENEMVRLYMEKLAISLSFPIQTYCQTIFIIWLTIHLLLISLLSVYSRLFQDQLVSEFKREDGVVWWAGVHYHYTGWYQHNLSSYNTYVRHNQIVVTLSY